MMILQGEGAVRRRNGQTDGLQGRGGARVRPQGDRIQMTGFYMFSEEVL